MAGYSLTDSEIVWPLAPSLLKKRTVEPEFLFAVKLFTIVNQMSSDETSGYLGYPQSSVAH